MTGKFLERTVCLSERENLNFTERRKKMHKIPLFSSLTNLLHYACQRDYLVKIISLSSDRVFSKIEPVKAN